MQGRDIFVFRENVMKQDHQTSFGRHISAVPLKSRALIEDATLSDKWALLTALTTAAQDFGLTHRTLSVLRALISFHPDKMISSTPRSSIVFPANRTLSERLGGMPESTLRRHLASLVASGIVSRHDSANRKRFARGRAGDTRIAFGFDLSPMARRATEIFARSEAAELRRTHLQTLRVELAALRQEVLEQRGDCELTEASFKLLRRKPDEEMINVAISELQTLLIAEKTSVSDDQNERHIQPESKIYSDLERRTDHNSNGRQKKQTPSFDAVVTQCSEYHSFFPEPARNWEDLSRIAYALAPMMGIDAHGYSRAVASMGAKETIVAVLCILENQGRIKNPGGYLERLSQQSVEGQLNLNALLFSRPKDKIIRNCQLTTHNNKQ